MDNPVSVVETFQKLGIALGLGLLVGMQRQRTDARLAGFRTFPLVTMLGTISALLAVSFGGWIVGAGLLGLTAFIVMGNCASPSKDAPDPGLTTEVALLLMFGIGAYLVRGAASVAVVLAGVTVVLLHFKPEMHAFARRVGEGDFRAMIQFVLITLVILPILPNRAYGPYEVLNPHKIWLLVVVIVGLSLSGYVAYKFVPASAGSFINGVLGGLISSTATTVSFARRARESPKASASAALVIMIASTVVFARVLILVGISAPKMFQAVAGPIGVMLGATVVITAAAWLFTRNVMAAMPQHGNPTELRSALLFALVFALVLVGTAAGKDFFGTQGLYAVAALSGLTDMDAITLSTMQMLQRQELAPDLAWRIVFVASLANLVFKAIIVASLGHRQLLARIGVLFGLAMASGVLILWLWPARSGGS